MRIKQVSRRERSDVRVISLRECGAVLRENDRLNEEFAGEYIAYIDRPKGSLLHRRIVAHSRSMLKVNEAIDRLSKKDQREIQLHYAFKMGPNEVWMGGGGDIIEEVS